MPLVDIKAKAFQAFNCDEVSLAWDPRNKLHKVIDLDLKNKQICLVVVYSKEIDDKIKKPNTFCSLKKVNFSISEPYDLGKFNFNLVIDERFPCFKLSDEDYLILNGYPILENSMLLIPKLRSCLPQYINSSDLLMWPIYLSLVNQGNDSNAESIPTIGYNSKGAGSSVNHLHFQVFFFNSLNYDPWLSYNNNLNIFFDSNFNGSLKIEKEEYSFKPLAFEGFEDIKCSLVKYEYQPNQNIGFCIIDYNETSNLKLPENINFPTNETEIPEVINKVSNCLFRIISKLNKANVPYNLLFKKGQAIIIPRRPDQTVSSACIGMLELMNIYSCYSFEEFTEMKAETFVASLISYLLSFEEFEQILE